MSDMPIFFHSLHIDLWDWLARNPEAQKEDWPEWKFNGGEVPSADYSCFACESATRVYPGAKYRSRDCNACPLDWSLVAGFFSLRCYSHMVFDDNNNSVEADGLFSLWEEASDLYRSALVTLSDDGIAELLAYISNLAILIRDMPLIENVHEMYQVI